MNWALAFIVAMPLLFAAFVFGMYKLRVGVTDWSAYPSLDPSQYPKDTDATKMKMIAAMCALLYVLLLFVAGPFAAALALAILMVVLALGSLVFTMVQELIFWLKGPKLDPETGAIVQRKPFRQRLLWNYADSFLVPLFFFQSA